MFNNKPSHPYRNFFEGVLIGGGVGAIIALMFTDKGKKIQKDLVEKYKMLENEVNHMGKKPIKKAVKKIKKAKAKAKKKIE